MGFHGSCAGLGGGKLHLGGSIYYTEDKKGGLKRNMSKGDVDFEKEDVMLCWVVTPTAPPPQERVLARSKKRKAEVCVEEEYEDEEAGTKEEEDEEEEEEEEEDGDEVVELGDKGEKGKTPEKGKAPQKKCLPVPVFPEVHEGWEGVEEGQASKKSRTEKDPEDEETKETTAPGRWHLPRAAVLGRASLGAPRMGVRITMCNMAMGGLHGFLFFCGFVGFWAWCVHHLVCVQLTYFWTCFETPICKFNGLLLCNHHCYASFFSVTPCNSTPS